MNHETAREAERERERERKKRRQGLQMKEEWKAPLGSFHLLISHSLASGDEFVASIVLSAKRKTHKLE